MIELDLSQANAGGESVVYLSDDSKVSSNR